MPKIRAKPKDSSLLVKIAGVGVAAGLHLAVLAIIMASPPQRPEMQQAETVEIRFVEIADVPTDAPQKTVTDVASVQPEVSPPPEPQAQPEPQPLPKPEPAPPPEPKPEPVPAPEPSAPEPEPEPVVQPKPAVEPDQSSIQPEPKPAVEPDKEFIQPEPKPEVEAEPKPEPQPEPKSEPKPELKPQPKPEPKPEPKTRPRSVVPPKPVAKAPSAPATTQPAAGSSAKPLEPKGPAQPVDPDRPRLIGKVDYLGQRPSPVYPRASQRRGEQGRVVVRVLISPQGSVLNASVQSSSGYPRLDEAAVKAARSARFKPYTENGIAYQAMADIPFDFVL